ncbi:ESF1 protein [Trichinella spiralis]|uniref:ESF1 protein n=1 Tax=Trichinella spiralis TaxID=6334 RepID=UPI0001EFC736|nr:ESF1 protein [Trichinella spiralis]
MLSIISNCACKVFDVHSMFNEWITKSNVLTYNGYLYMCVFRVYFVFGSFENYTDPLLPTSTLLFDQQTLIEAGKPKSSVLQSTLKQSVHLSLVHQNADNETFLFSHWRH